MILDYGYPFVTPNSITGSGKTLLGELVRIFVSASSNLYAEAFQIPSKIALLLSRGADPSLCDQRGDNFLHRVLLSRRKYSTYDGLVTPEFNEELKDILMLLITAGADVFAVNNYGQRVCDIAIGSDIWLEWEEALEECGHDPEAILNFVDEGDQGRSTAIDIPSKATQRSLLILSEYLEIRKARLLNLEVGPDETYIDVYREYYDLVVPQEKRIVETDDSDWETKEDEELKDSEDDLDTEDNSSVEFERSNVGVEFPKQKND